MRNTSKTVISATLEAGAEKSRRSSEKTIYVMVQISLSYARPERVRNDSMKALIPACHKLHELLQVFLVHIVEVVELIAVYVQDQLHFAVLEHRHHDL